MSRGPGGFRAKFASEFGCVLVAIEFRNAHRLLDTLKNGAHIAFERRTGLRAVGIQFSK